MGVVEKFGNRVAFSQPPMLLNEVERQKWRVMYCQRRYLLYIFHVELSFVYCVHHLQQCAPEIQLVSSIVFRSIVSFNGVSDCHKAIRVFQLLSCTFFLVKFGNNTNKRKNRQFGFSVTISRVQKLVHLREKDDFCTHLYGRNLDLSIQKTRKIIVT